MRLVRVSQITARMRTLMHERATDGAYSEEILREYAQIAYEEIYEDLVACTDGNGTFQLQKTIQVAEPDGYIPGSRVPIPENLLSIAVVRRQGVDMRKGSPDRRQLLDNYLTGATAGYWWIDGANQTTDPVTGLLINNRAVLLVTPPFSAGELLEIIYTEQAPLLTDPTDPDNDVEVDLISNAIFNVVAALAAALAVARDDSKALTRARQEAERVFNTYRKRLQDVDNRPIDIEAYQTRNVYDRKGW